MLKYREIIRRMTLEQKVAVLTSNKYNETVGIKEYDIPTMNMADVTKLEHIGNNDEFYPSLKALASTWNEELIEHVAYSCVNLDNKNKDNKELYKIPCNYNAWLDCFSEDPYLNGRIAKVYAKGLHEAGATICLDKAVHIADSTIKEYREEKLLPIEMALDSNPEAIIASSGAPLDVIRKELKYGNSLFVENESEESVLSFINGADFVFDSNNDVTKELFDAVLRHKGAKVKLRKGELTEDQFIDYCVRNNAIDEKDLDVKIDRYLELLKQVNPKIFMSKVVFSDEQVKKLMIKTARESIILLKNKGILPFNSHHKIALIGDFARNPQINLAAEPTMTMDNTLELINKYINDTIGFAHGYTDDAKDDVLINLACGLATKADVALVYLGVKNDKVVNKLPESQLALIDALYEKKHKIVAVVSANHPIDMSFAEKCEAVVLTRVAGSYQMPAILDVLFGHVNPCGKLTESISFDLDGGNYKDFELVNKPVLYPFGYGLSYSYFEYSHLTINEHGVTFTIKNAGSVDGYEIAQLYVGKEKSDLPRNKKDLRGYTKVFVKHGESVKAFIPFDKQTFAYYSENKECFDIENGEYQIYIASSSADVRLEANFEVFVKHPEDGKNVGIDQKLTTKKSLKKFTYSDSKKDYYKDRIGISKPKKVLLTLLVMLFFDTVLGSIAYQNWMDSESELLHWILVGILAVFNLICLIYILVSLIRKSPKISKHPVDELTKMMSEVSEFKEIAKVVYEKPVEEVVEEEEVVVEEQTEEEDEEETVIEYSNAISYKTVDEKRTIKNVDLGRLCDRLCRYSMSKGIVVDPKSARLVLGSMAAGHLIVVHSPAQHLVEPFLDILGQFFGDEKFTLDASNRVDLHSILWDLNKNNNTYESTDLSKVLLKAQNLNKTMHTCTIKNVKFEDFTNAFAKILAFVNNPGATIKVKLNEEETVKLGKNLWFFLITDEAIPEHIATSVLEINVSLRTAEEEVQFNEQTGISLPDFNDNVNAAKELFFISESNWKRIDEFVEHINELEKFKIGNKQVLQMENFTSTYMAANADEAEALDMVFVSKLIPILKHTKTYLSVDGELKLIEYITRSFEEEALVQTQKILKSKN